MLVENEQSRYTRLLTIRSHVAIKCHKIGFFLKDMRDNLGIDCFNLRCWSNFQYLSYVLSANKKFPCEIYSHVLRTLHIWKNPWRDSVFPLYCYKNTFSQHFVIFNLLKCLPWKQNFYITTFTCNKNFLFPRIR